MKTPYPAFAALLTMWFLSGSVLPVRAEEAEPGERYVDVVSVESSVKSNEAMLGRFEAQRARLLAEGEAAKAAELDGKIEFLRAENRRNAELLESARKKSDSSKIGALAPAPPPAPKPESEPGAEDFTGKDWTMMPPDQKERYATEAIDGLKELGVPVEKNAVFYVIAVDERLAFDPSFEGKYLGDVFISVIGEKEPKTRPVIERLRSPS